MDLFLINLQLFATYFDVKFFEFEKVILNIQLVTLRGFVFVYFQRQAKNFFFSKKVYNATFFSKLSRNFVFVFSDDKIEFVN